MKGRTAPGLLAAALVLCFPAPAFGQSGTAALDQVEESFDSATVLGRARSEQAGFERERARLLPRTLSGWTSQCDEIVGRFCEWYDEGEWVPRPEDPEIQALRQDLLAYLDSVAILFPGDDWIHGQRVWYRTEAGDWGGAAATARACGGAEPWWCWALEGLALHGAGSYGAADSVYARALAAMPPDQERRWRLPRRAVDGALRGILDDLEDAPLDSVMGVLDRVWTLADPLFLVEGNDRRTAHYARWTVSTLRERARNPFGMAWGRDLEELTVRHGWELWWERAFPRDPMSGDHIIGHKHPEGRDYMPPGDVIRRPWEASPVDLRADKRNPRSLYAPDYAPVLLPMEAQIAVFRRGDRVAVVAGTSLPPDTTTHAGHDHPVPWLEPGEQAGLADRAGVFLAALDGRQLHRAEAALPEATSIFVEAPAGLWLLSAEAWSPWRRRAGRLRMMVSADTLPPHVPTLSDLLFVAPGAGDPASLEHAAAGALPRAEITADETVGVVWEVWGLGHRPTTLDYRASVERRDGNILRRAGRWLGLVGDPDVLQLTWSEPGPDTPQGVLRRLDLQIPALEPGTYEVRLEVGLEEQGRLTSVGLLAVRPPM